MQRLVGLAFLSVGVLAAGLVMILVVVDILIHGGPDAEGSVVLAGSIILVASVLYVAYILMEGTASKVEGAPAWEGDFLVGIPEAREIEGGRYQVIYRPAVRKWEPRPSTLTVSVPVATPVALQFARETPFDRWSKRWCIAREVQTHDPEFDELVYIRARSDMYARRYLRDAGRRQAIVSLLTRDFDRVQLTGTHAEAVWSGFDPTNDDRPELIEETARTLFILGERLPIVRAGDKPARLDGNLILYWLLWLPIVGLAPIVLFCLRFPPVRGWQLALAGCTAFALVYPCYGLVTAILLRGKSTSHDRWARLMGPGVLLIGLSSFGMTAAVNALGDATPLKVRSVEIREKRTERLRRGRIGHSVYVDAWDSPGEMIKFPVSIGDFQLVTPGRSRLELAIGEGRLGIPWVKSQTVRP